jgi:hypothetical protein
VRGKTERWASRYVQSLSRSDPQDLTRGPSEDVNFSLLWESGQRGKKTGSEIKVLKS